VAIHAGGVVRILTGPCLLAMRVLLRAPKGVRRVLRAEQVVRRVRDRVDSIAKRVVLAVVG
jgi:hypothetical protein